MIEKNKIILAMTAFIAFLALYGIAVGTTYSVTQNKETYDKTKNSK